MWGIILTVIIIFILFVFVLSFLFAPGAIFREDGKYRHPVGPETHPPVDTLEWSGDNGLVTYSSLGTRGNMGNQIFEIACTIAVAKRNNRKFAFPPGIRTLKLAELFNLNSLPLISEAGETVRIHEYDNYEDISLPALDGIIYDIRGYRQSILYFEDILGPLRKLFVPRPELILGTKSKLAAYPSYIALHIRRNDYLRYQYLFKILPWLQWWGYCSIAYYKSAIALIRDTFGLPLTFPVIISTDDREWAEKHCEEIDPYAILNPEGGVFADFISLYLADYIVIANSTFSYWAALLREKRMVIRPSPWWCENSAVSHLFRLDKSPICPRTWLALDTTTGELRGSELYSKEEWVNPNRLYRTLRAICVD